MTIITQNLFNVKLIKPEIQYDFRGQYVETWNEEKYKTFGVKFVQDDVSFSKKNTLRGLHGDNKTWKLIQCLYGEIYVAIVDMRKNSPTFEKFQTFAINDNNRYQLLIPPGVANGHLCLSDKCIFSYKQSEYYSGAENQFTVKWNKYPIYWPIKDPILSERDANAKD
jgi:dTDP-4-dehydrorhamnose 3,5-epimerase